MKVYRVTARAVDFDRGVRDALADMDRDDPSRKEPCVLELPAGEWPSHAPIFVERDNLTIRRFPTAGGLSTADSLSR